MPKPNEHLSWARQNETFADTLDADTQVEANWAVTALFYAAVHYVNAYLVSRGLARQDHAVREASMRQPFFDPVRTKYKRLKDMSREARYEIAPYCQRDVERAKGLLNEIKNHVLTKFS